MKQEYPATSNNWRLETKFKEPNKSQASQSKQFINPVNRLSLEVTSEEALHTLDKKNSEELPLLVSSELEVDLLQSTSSEVEPPMSSEVELSTSTEVGVE